MSAGGQELLYRIALTQVPFVGPVVAKNVLSYLGGSAEAVFKAGEAKLLKIPQVGKKTANAIKNFSDFKRAEDEISYIEKHSIQPLFYADKDYPERLKQQPDCPLLLFYKGNTNLNNARTIGIVGTRSPSNYGKEWTEKLVEDLAETGCVVISGLAYGIDSVAHKAALKNKLNTVGVLGNGLKTIYPAQNKMLATQMIEQGGLLTEYLNDIKPDASNFPERNRIVAAMCDAVVVVETKKKGGSMITAELANQYNKDVFTLPGRVGDELSEGCNFLIKNHKAALVESAADILYLLNWQQGAKKAIPKLFPELNKNEQRVFDLLKGHVRLGIDEICNQLDMPQHLLAMVLLEMELKDCLRSLPGKQYELR
ncbi:MAG: DNA-protecting protein DprA [Flavobacteriaceae bacterium]|nr:DNA-protecting protein DprA [Flavobacteriaceae bacterium]